MKTQQQWIQCCLLSPCKYCKAQINQPCRKPNGSPLAVKEWNEKSLPFHAQRIDATNRRLLKEKLIKERQIEKACEDCGAEGYGLSPESQKIVCRQCLNKKLGK